MRKQASTTTSPVYLHPSLQSSKTKKKPHWHRDTRFFLYLSFANAAASLYQWVASLSAFTIKKAAVNPSSTGMLGSHSFSLFCKMQQHTYGTASLFFLRPSFVNTAASSLLSNCQFLCIYHYPSYANAATCFSTNALPVSLPSIPFSKKCSNMLLWHQDARSSSLISNHSSKPFYEWVASFPFLYPPLAKCSSMLLEPGCQFLFLYLSYANAAASFGTGMPASSKATYHHFCSFQKSAQ